MIKKPKPKTSKNEIRIAKPEARMLYSILLAGLEYKMFDPIVDAIKTTGRDCTPEEYAKAASKAAADVVMSRVFEICK
jgi:hypothetical protein